MESHETHVPNHQPDHHISPYIPLTSTDWTLFSWQWQDICPVPMYDQPVMDGTWSIYLDVLPLSLWAGDFPQHNVNFPGGAMLLVTCTCHEKPMIFPWSLGILPMKNTSNSHHFPWNFPAYSPHGCSITGGYMIMGQNPGTRYTKIAA